MGIFKFYHLSDTLFEMLYEVQGNYMKFFSKEEVEKITHDLDILHTYTDIVKNCLDASNKGMDSYEIDYISPYNQTIRKVLELLKTYGFEVTIKQKEGGDEYAVIQYGGGNKR